MNYFGLLKLYKISFPYSLYIKTRRSYFYQPYGWGVKQNRTIYKVYLCIHKYMETTIRLNNSVKEKLDLIKVHARESYNDVINRMVGEYKTLNVDEESLRETVEILGDPEILKDIAEALNDFEKGKFIELK